MSQPQDVYEVSCPSIPAINGHYVLDKKNYYLQAGGLHILTKHSSGVWGVGDSKNFLALSSENTAMSPSEVRSWKYLLGGTYRPCPEMKISRPRPQQQLPTPPVQQKTESSNVGPRPGDSVSDWEVRKEKDWVGNVQTYYVNIYTGARQNNMPEVLIEEQKKPPNMCGYEIESVTGGAPVTIYAPIKHANTAGRPISKTYRSEAWSDVENLWSKGILALDGEIRIAQHALQKLRSYEKNFEEEKKTLGDTVARMQQQLEDTREREKVAMLRSDVIVNRLGKGHIKRDGQALAGSEFPCGEEITREFRDAFRNFEAFAYDVTNSLDEMKCPNSSEVLVDKVMFPIFCRTRDLVNERVQDKHAMLHEMFGVTVEDEEASSEDSIAKQFFYSTQQTQLLRRIQEMDEEKIAGLMLDMGPTVTNLNKAMQAAAAKGLIGQDINILKLVKLMLRFHAVSELSDPRCYLYPNPRLHVAYKEGIHVEILSPGTKTHGRIKEGEEVEVVLPGLYFENPAVSAGPPAAAVSRAGAGRGMAAKGKAPEPPAIKPVVPCLVRRIVGSPSKDKVIGAK